MATYEGMGLCESKEYHDAFQSRLQQNQIARGEVYVARFRLDDPQKAYRVMGRIGMKSAEFDDFSELVFQLLDDDMQPLRAPASGFMNNGIWNSYEPLVLRRGREGAVVSNMRDGCFSEYEEGFGFDGELKTYLDLGVTATSDRQLTLV